MQRNGVLRASLGAIAMAAALGAATPPPMARADQPAPVADPKDPQARKGFFAPKSDGRFLVRLRAIAILPDEASETSVRGGAFEIENAFVPELDFSYFFTENFAAELVIATAPHRIDGSGSLEGIEFGHFMLLPATLTAQYHLTVFERVKPYIGAGVAYSIFAGLADEVRYDDTVGVALQAGVDYELAEGWFLNADVKYMMLETEIEVDDGATQIDAEVDFDSVVIGFGAGYRF